MPKFNKRSPASFTSPSPLFVYHLSPISSHIGYSTSASKPLPSGPPSSFLCFILVYFYSLYLIPRRIILCSPLHSQLLVHIPELCSFLGFALMSTIKFYH